MKKVYALLLVAMAVFGAMAAPADRTPVPVMQPDGSTLMLRLVGDEFFHYNTTVDGYTILPVNGGWQYAISRDSQLQPSGRLAHDLDLRTEAERQWLAQVPQHLTAASDIAAARQARARNKGPAERTPAIDYSNFRGLIILVDYTDLQFSMENPSEFYNQMVNQRHYTGFDYNGQYVPCTGSVRDYFNDQSSGLFDPQFDVVGPVTVPFECTAHTGNSNSWRVFKAAMDSVGPKLDLSQYDLNHDGMVDMIIFIGAGFASSFGGNNSNYLWPHKSLLYDYDTHTYLRYNGIFAGTYAATIEMYGWEAETNSTPMGIGTIAHEFGHVLGLPDTYDTDYSGSGGQSHNPGDWDVMASGNNLNMSRTPPGYNLWERYALGWANPPILDQAGSYSLQALNTSNEGYILRTPVDQEYFTIENRQQTGWDAYLPGHGMLIFRVDSTSTGPWSQNTVNANPSHNYFEMLRAGGSTSGASASDAFPGSDDVNNCSNYRLHTWSGDPNQYMLNEIIEQDGVITFNAIDMSQLSSLVETFDPMPESDGTTVELEGDLATWKLIKSKVVADGDNKQIAMVNPSNLTMTTPVSHRYITRVTFEVSNPSSTLAKFALYYSLDGGSTWVKATSNYFEVAANSMQVVDWLGTSFSPSQEVQFRIGMVAGHKSTACLVDNFTLYYVGEETLPGDLNGDGNVDVSDVNIAINIILGKAEYQSVADLNGDNTVDVSDVNAIINIILGKG